MLPYRILEWLSDVYPMTVLFLYIGLAMFTFSICFLMPPAAILMLIFSIFALAPAVLGFRILKASQTFLARKIIRQHQCPSCGEELQGAQQCDCLVCGVAWDPEGVRIAA
ncbi:MAG: hypothetical protein GY895_20890 [Phycisphaera sp.]|nr:hypothetical protein [Phycisphaera sp.]